MTRRLLYRGARLAFILLALFSLYRLLIPGRPHVAMREMPPSAASAAARQSLGAAQNMVPIQLNDMVELDYRSKKEIDALRRALVAAYPAFSPPDYAPRDSIFGQITDGKPWWGILGLSYYGNDPQHSIDGPSEESRFIANPYLLVGLDMSGATIVWDSSIAPHPVYPVPTGLWWRQDGRLAIARYDVSAFQAASQQIHTASAFRQKLYLAAYNARDFGYNHLYVSPQESENITAATQPARLIQFIHTGGSCGHPGGCNNMSPHQPEMEITVDALPALAFIKLWKQAPADAAAPADMVFAIEME